MPAQDMARIITPFGLPSMAFPNIHVTSFSRHPAISHLTRGTPKLFHSMRSVRSGHVFNVSKQCSRQLAKVRMSTFNVEKAQKNVASFESDLVIIGGGAGGIAVAAHIMELVKKGKQLRSITLVEKSNSIGPGLAYSDACVGTILNMEANKSGIYADDPEHLTRWMGLHFPNLKETAYPQRQLYGAYLSSVLNDLVKDASQNGITFRVINDEAIDISPIDEDLEVVLNKGTRIQTANAVLALGNFITTLNPKLGGSPGFFSSPWPLKQLKVIESDAPVSILGSGLTAIDVAISLVENGHRGNIKFISRNGRLPKVRGIAPRYQRRYMMHSLARDVESSEGEVFGKIVSTIKQEIESFEGGNHYEYSDLKHFTDPLKGLQADIKDAENGTLRWQEVLRATTPVVERYWNCMSSKEKAVFLRDYIGMWFQFRYAMPLENARKILVLMEQGQLRVLRSASGTRSDTRWDGSHFAVATNEGDIQSKYLIEAVGQEHNPCSIKSALMERLLSKGILKPHAAGGISVNFSNLSATKNIHVIGSMTRGTHFFTNSVDRIAIHASRIADSITATPFRRSLHIAFFVGSDLFSHLMLSKLIPRLIAQGHTPFIFLPTDLENQDTSSPSLRELDLYKRQLLHDQFIPFSRSPSFDGAGCLNVEQMGAQYGLLVQKVKSVNDGSLDILRKHHVDAGFSLRCEQRFGKDVMNYFTAPRALLNLHPGVQPSHRRETTAEQGSFGYSLRHVSSSDNSGLVLDVRTIPVDYEKSVFHHMNDSSPIGVEMVLNAVDNLARGKDMPAIEQIEGQSRYYSFPTEEGLDMLREKGMKRVDAAAM